MNINLRLVAHIVKKYQNQSDDKEDLISIGTIGLIKAIDSFSPDKGTKLATYAARCIDNEILMLFRSTKKMRNDVSLYDPIGFDKEGNEICLIDVVKDEEQDINDVIIQQLAIEKIAKKTLMRLLNGNVILLFDDLDLEITKKKHNKKLQSHIIFLVVMSLESKNVL